MKKIQILAFSLLSTFTLAFTSCNSNESYVDTNYKETPQVGFDVQQFADLVNNTSNLQSLEESINKPGNSIHNMDVDNDGMIDYLSVQENGNQIQVIDQATETPQVVATVNFPNQNNTTYMTINGHPNYCGNGYYYNAPYVNAFMLAYLLHPHPYYRSVYGYHHYPSYYSPRRTVTTRIKTKTYKNYDNSSKKNKSYKSDYNSYSRKSISNPTSSQRSFEVRDNSKKVNASGFGKKSSFGSSSSSNSRSSFGSSKSSFGSSSSSSPRSSFGSSKSSFGSSRSSFGSSRKK